MMPVLQPALQVLSKCSCMPSVERASDAAVPLILLFHVVFWRATTSSARGASPHVSFAKQTAAKSREDTSKMMPASFLSQNWQQVPLHLWDRFAVHGLAHSKHTLVKRTGKVSGPSARFSAMTTTLQPGGQRPWSLAWSRPSCRGASSRSPGAWVMGKGNRARTVLQRRITCSSCNA